MSIHAPETVFESVLHDAAKIVHDLEERLCAAGLLEEEESAGSLFAGSAPTQVRSHSSAKSFC